MRMKAEDGFGNAVRMKDRLILSGLDQKYLRLRMRAVAHTPPVHPEESCNRLNSPSRGIAPRNLLWSPPGRSSWGFRPVCGAVRGEGCPVPVRLNPASAPPGPDRCPTALRRAPKSQRG